MENGINHYDDESITLVIGLDAEHLNEAEISLPTWIRHDEEFLSMPVICFYDHTQITEMMCRETLIANADITYIPWPRSPRSLYGDYEKRSKWDNPHRYMMLSGYVHIPQYVKTKYWMKVDTDCVAFPGFKLWEDEWFADSPAIVAHPWGITKPPKQMVAMDQWVMENDINIPELAGTKPLNLIPEPGAEKVKHRRIISWCGFFETEFTQTCSNILHRVYDNADLMPIQSQDGFHWYMAARMGRNVTRMNMKKRNWQHWGTWKNLEKHCAESMERAWI